MYSDISNGNIYKDIPSVINYYLKRHLETCAESGDCAYPFSMFSDGVVVKFDNCVVAIKNKPVEFSDA